MFNRAAIYPAVATPPLTTGAARLQAPLGARIVHLIINLDSGAAGTQCMSLGNTTLFG